MTSPPVTPFWGRPGEFCDASRFILILDKKLYQLVEEKISSEKAEDAAELSPFPGGERILVEFRPTRVKGF